MTTDTSVTPVQQNATESCCPHDDGDHVLRYCTIPDCGCHQYRHATSTRIDKEPCRECGEGIYHGLHCPLNLSTHGNNVTSPVLDPERAQPARASATPQPITPGVVRQPVSTPLPDGGFNEGLEAGAKIADTLAAIYKAEPDPDLVSQADVARTTAERIAENIRFLVAPSGEAHVATPADQSGTYIQGIEDALRIAIPIAKCSCADLIVDALRRQRDKVRNAALATEGAPKESDGWYPIESAPKDGTIILLAAKGLESWIQMTGSWAAIRDIDWYFIGGGWMGISPTHWMPLLPSPEKQEKQR